MHLVSWDKVCNRKEDGGLGLRKAKLQNNAYMMKLGWAMMHRRDTLWVQLIREKYGCGSQILPNIKKGKKGSKVWQGVCGVWDSFTSNLKWKLGNGLSINFWKDRWLPDGTRLEDEIIGEIPSNLAELRVA